MNPPTDRERPALSEDDLAAMVFPPDARFTFMDDPGEHDPCYVVMPGGAALPLNHHVGEGVDVARAKFIIDACNAALDRLATPNMGRVAQAVRRVLAAQMTGSIVERLTADITDAVMALGGGSVAEDLASPKPALTQGGVAVDHIVASTKGLAHHVDRDGVGWWNVKLTSAHVEELVALEHLAGERGGEAVAWQVKDFADGWIPTASKAHAEELSAAMDGAIVRPLYAAPQPLPVEVEREGNQDLMASQTSPVGHGACPCHPRAGG